MRRWVALLRGVNVGGVTIRSADLRALVEQLGLTDVRTVLASGNVVFDAPDEEPAAAVGARLEAGLRERFGYDARVVLVDAGRLAEVARGFPFDASDPARTPYVVFGSDPEVLAGLAERARDAASGEEDPVLLAGDVLYWHPPTGRSTDTPFARLAAASRYRAHTTTRNLRTVQKVLAAARG